MVGVSASVNLSLHYEVQKFSSGTSLPGWSRKKVRKMVVVVCGGNQNPVLLFVIATSRFSWLCVTRDCALYAGAMGQLLAQHGWAHGGK